jgi:LuxR family maltose regulon positive regulatory protein
VFAAMPMRWYACVRGPRVQGRESIVDVPLLTAKLYVPSLRRKMMPRSCLVERLDAGLDGKLTLISAPAGYGKTTLLAQWLLTCERHVAWLSLDEGDNDPVRFWAYVVAALRTVYEEIGEMPQAAFQSPLPRIEPALAGLLNQITEAPDPLVLVLDDYHVIRTPAIHEGIAFLLENLSPQMHLVIATRADPPLPIPRLRGRGQLTELYQSDLRFTLEEAATFLNEVMGLQLSEEDVAALERRTEGWIAGLQMAAVSMQRRDDVAGFIQAFTGTHRYILDYLVEEVLQQQSPAMQTFLLQTSILGRLSSRLCDAVMGAHEPAEGRPSLDSQSVLEQLERNNLFVVPLDDRRRWYRYHRLFADLLQQRLQREQRELVPELHRRAGEWYEENGAVREAVNHALAAGDAERAAHLIEGIGWSMLARCEMMTLLDWLAVLPWDFVRSRPQLVVLQAWALAMTGQWAGAESCLADVDLESVRGQVAAVRAYIAGVRGDVPRTIELAEQALDQLLDKDLFLRSRVILSLGIAYFSRGKPTDASRALTEAIALSQAAGHTYMRLAAMMTLGHVQEMQGSLGQAVETHQEALRLAVEQGGQPAPIAGMAHVGIAEALYEWNDLEGALDHAIKGIELTELGGFTSYQLAGYVRLATVYQARGDVERALAVVGKAEQLAQQHDYAYMSGMIAKLRIQLWVAAQGHLAAASRWAEEHGWYPVGEPDLAREAEQIAVARVRIARALSHGLDSASEIGVAQELLARLLAAAEKAGRIGKAIEILVLCALAFQIQGDGDGALCALERALILGEPGGYVRTFLDEGEPIARLLSQILVARPKERQARSRGPSPNYVARLLAAFGEEAELAPPAMESLVEPLTGREMDVLRLVVGGLSNAEIAEELVIAVSTVKSHINHIYGKLGVENRTQAVIRAQELALL